MPNHVHLHNSPPANDNIDNNDAALFNNVALFGMANNNRGIDELGGLETNKPNNNTNNTDAAPNVEDDEQIGNHCPLVEINMDALGISEAVFDLHPGVDVFLREIIYVDEDMIDEGDQAIEDLIDTMKVMEGIGNLDNLDDTLEDIKPLSFGGDAGLAEATGKEDKRPLSYFVSYIKRFTNQLFFMNQHNEPRGGIRNVVHCANAEVKSSNGFANLDLTKSIFNFTDLLVVQPPSMQEKILLGQQLLLNLCVTELVLDVEIPVDRGEADKLCMRSRFSIFANIPSKEVFKIDGHACISLSNLINCKFSQSIEFSFKQAKGKRNRDAFNGTAQADEFMAELEEKLQSSKVASTYFGQLML